MKNRKKKSARIGRYDHIKPIESDEVMGRIDFYNLSVRKQYILLGIIDLDSSTFNEEVTSREVESCFRGRIEQVNFNKIQL